MTAHGLPEDHKGNGTYAYGPCSVFIREVVSLALFFQELLHFDGGHTTGTRGSDGLPVAPVLDIAAREHSVNACEDVVVSLQVSLRIHVKLAGKHLCVRLVPDSQEQRARRKVKFLPRLQIF